MLKFLRKYNKLILVVFGCFLMVAFLVPQGLQQLFRNSAGPLRATYGEGVKVRQRDWARANVEADIIGAIWPSLTQAIGLEDDPAHWILLVHEAQVGGFVGEWRDGQRRLESLIQQAALGVYVSQAQQAGYGQFAQQAALQAWNDPEFAKALGITVPREQVIENVRRELLARARSQASLVQMTERDLYMAIAKAAGIERMFGSYLRLAVPSDRRTLIEAKRTRDQVQADVVFLPADLLLPGVPEPTDEQIREQFEAYRDTRDGEGTYGIGYTLPPRVRFETMRVDAESVRSLVEPDLVAIRKRYTANPQKYAGSFEESEDRIRLELIDERTDEVLRAARQAFSAELFVRTQNLRADGVYKTLPPDWQPIDFERLAQVIADDVADATGVRIPLPVVQRRVNAWWTARDLATDPDLSLVRWRSGQRVIPLYQAMLSVRELVPDANTGVQVGLPPAEPAVDLDGSLVFFQVLAARPESPPDAPDEIRDRIARDWRRIRAYEQLAGRLGELRAAAVAGGLQAAIDLVAPEPEDSPETPEQSAPEQPSEPAPAAQPDDPPPADSADQPEPSQPEAEPESSPAVEPEAPEAEDGADDLPRPSIVRGVIIAREGSSAPPQLNAEPFRTAAVEAGMKIDPLKPLDQITPEEATFGAAVPTSLGVGLGRITRVLPLTEERFRLVAEQVASEITAGEVIPRLSDLSPFTLERLKERHGWTEVR